MGLKINGEEFTTFDDYMHDDVTPSEKAQIKFETDLIGKIVEAREAKGLSQRDLAKLSGVKQPAIARIESMKTTPQIDTLIKVLTPLGYTLSITPISQE